MEQRSTRSQRGAVLMSEAAKRNQRILGAKSYSSSYSGYDSSNYSPRSGSSYRPRYDRNDYQSTRTTTTINRPRSIYDYRVKNYDSSGSNSGKSSLGNTKATEKEDSKLGSKDAGSQDSEDDAKRDSVDSNGTGEQSSDSKEVDDTEYKDCKERLKEKQDDLTADFDDFETKMKKIKERMKNLLDKHEEVQGRMESGGRDSDEGEDHQWEYFQQQNKLLKLAVSKLWQKEGFDPSRLLNPDEFDFKSNGLCLEKGDI
eukprot:Seg1829.3 transcript_id=Seg1829.3/GoldUCD/mRNA.D3Y31 product="hypothetical protein" protein_id=Seg1829.3/GoldUCD/D3Y31